MITVFKYRRDEVNPIPPFMFCDDQYLVEFVEYQIINKYAVNAIFQDRNIIIYSDFFEVFLHPDYVEQNPLLFHELNPFQSGYLLEPFDIMDYDLTEEEWEEFNKNQTDDENTE